MDDSLDRQRDRLDGLTRRVAAIGFTGLVAMAVLTMFDASMRYLGLPRIPGFSDFGEVIYAVVIASCFPAGLLHPCLPLSCHGTQTSCHACASTG